MSEIGLVAGMGGILSLCMGFSLVTLAETGYHAMLGILSFIKEYRKQKTNKTGKYIPLTEFTALQSCHLLVHARRITDFNITPTFI